MADIEDLEKPKAQMHGFSGALLLIVDNALFGANAASLGLVSPFFWLAAFVFTGTAVFLVQKYMSEDDTGLALTKGFVVGVLAGVPTSITGSAGAFYIVGAAGFRAIRGKS